MKLHAGPSYYFYIYKNPHLVYTVVVYTLKVCGGDHSLSNFLSERTISSLTFPKNVKARLRVARLDGARGNSFEAPQSCASARQNREWS